jgi:hypothetical protein
LLVELKLNFVEYVGQQHACRCPKKIFQHRKYGGKQGFEHELK